MRHFIVNHGIVIWHRPGRTYASQGPYKANVFSEGDMVRDAAARARAELRALAALVAAKVAEQQLRRPPAPDSRPRRCHARPMGCKLICRPCRLSWDALGQNYPACKGDE